MTDDRSSPPRRATCRCGQLAATCEGEPFRVSVCHCFDCQKRSGSAFAAQARFRAESVQIEGAAATWTHVGDSGAATVFSFCPTCGSTLFYRGGGFPDAIAVAVGAFADSAFPPPRVSVWESRKHPWVVVSGDGIEHD